MRQAFLVEQPRHSALRALNYEPSVESLRKTRRGQRIVRLRDIVAEFGTGYASVFARIACEPEHGVEFLSQSDMFAAEPQGRIIRRDSMQNPERHEVKKWQVLLAGAGTLAPTELYGRAIVADGRLVGKYIGQDTLVLGFKEPGDDLSLFAYAYLASPTGLRAVRASSYGTKVLRIRRDTLADLPIPQPDELKIKRVAALVRECVARREEYAQELHAARSVLEDLPEMREAHAMCAERRTHRVTWNGALPTLCAWTYASTGGALGHLRRKWRTRLRDVLEPNGLYNGPRFARINCEAPHGVEFMSQRDVLMIRSATRRVVQPPIPDRLLFVPKSAVLAGSHGQVADGGIFGRVELASFGAHKCGVTQDILRLLFKPQEREIAFAFLSTLVGQRLLKGTAVGTSIPAMRLDLLLELPYPEFNVEAHCRVRQHVRSAERARIAGSDAESEAIRIIEEEVLPAWLA